MDTIREVARRRRGVKGFTLHASKAFSKERVGAMLKPLMGQKLSKLPSTLPSNNLETFELLHVFEDMIDSVNFTRSGLKIGLLATAQQET